MLLVSPMRTEVITRTRGVFIHIYWDENGVNFLFFFGDEFYFQGIAGARWRARQFAHSRRGSVRRAPLRGRFHERYRDARTASFFGLVNWYRLFNKINPNLNLKECLSLLTDTWPACGESLIHNHGNMRVKKSDN